MCTKSVNNLVQELHCGISLLWHNWKVRHSVDELYRGTVHVRLGLLEHKQHDHRDVHDHPGPVFENRPGLAVYPGGGGPTGCERSPLSTSRPPQAPRAAATTYPSAPAALPPAGALSAAQEGEQGTASALPPTVPPTRLLEKGTLQDRVLKNLGHFDDLLDVRQRLVEDLQHCHH